MDAAFWKQRWESNQIAFHEPVTNPLLLAHFGKLNLAKGSRVFVPLCGKTLDIHWLLANGYRVAGAELSEIAVRQLFDELKLKPQAKKAGASEHFSAPDIDIFVGDIFELSAELLGPVDAVYDRAALVALPPAVRPRYTAHLRALTAHAPQLLICYEYDQSIANGPPFSISIDEVKKHYGPHYIVALQSSVDVPGGLRGKCPAIEHVWLLTNCER